MSRNKRNLVIIVAAFSALGIAGIGLGDPPSDKNAPLTKPAARRPLSSAPRETDRPTQDSRTDTRATTPQVTDNSPENPASPATKPKHTAAADATDVPTPDEAFDLLRRGNERWVNNQPEAPNTDSARREDASQNGQKPFATVLTCADSRLPVERIFDRGVGDLFVVRVAGNVASGEVTGSIEYGAEHLHVPLLVVMGHTKCGAVAAAASGAEVGGNVGTLVEKITPAVSRARQQAPGADAAEILTASVKENVWQTMFDIIRTSPEMRHLVKEGKVKIVGAVCNVGTGKVEWIGEHPWQTALVDAFDAKAASKTTETADADQH